jgi:hypothetical protein
LDSEGVVVAHHASALIRAPAPVLESVDSGIERALLLLLLLLLLAWNWKTFC